MATSMKDIKNRIKSVESTMQITKAMELVATSKLRHAKNAVEKSRPYFETLLDTISELESSLGNIGGIFSSKREVKKHCYIVIAGDRGLAGGFNQNLFKSVLAKLPADNNASVLPIGKKVSEFFVRRNIPIINHSFETAAEITIGDCHDIAKIVYEGFVNGDFNAISIFYTKFNSMLSQTPVFEQILPFENNQQNSKGNLTLYEPSKESVLEHIVPLYISGTIFGAVSESRASEYAARRTAMNSANKNAEDMIGNLTLKFNRARQAAITQEITEIVAGAGDK